jgi:hypothetical protein
VPTPSAPGTGGGMGQYSGNDWSQASSAVTSIFSHGKAEKYEGLTQATEQAKSEANRLSQQIPQLQANLEKVKNASMSKGVDMSGMGFDDLFNQFLDQVEASAPDKNIDLNSIPNPPDSALPYQIQSEGQFGIEIRDIYKNLYKIDPYYDVRKNAKELGLFAVEEADQFNVLGNDEEANFYKELAEGFLDIAVGIDPVTGTARGVYELFYGKNLITGEKLNRIERGLAFINVATLGGSSSLKNLSTGLIKIAGRSTYLAAHSQAIRSSIAIGKSLGKSTFEFGIAKGQQFNQFMRTSAGQLWARTRATGSAISDYGYKLFDKGSKVSNPLPSDGVFARVMPREYAEKLLTGESNLARLTEDKLGRPVNEAFITAFEDIAHIKTPDGIAQRLALYTDEAGSQLVDLAAKDSVIVKFRFTDDVYKGIRSPINPLDAPRNYGYVPGGLAGGGAREWLVNVDAIEKGIIDKASIVFEEIVR